MDKRYFLLTFFDFLLFGFAEKILMPDELWSAGYIHLEQTQGNDIFYFLLNSKDGNTSAPFLIWLNGGPGCSSSLGLFMEIGPYVVDRITHKLSFNNFSWNAFSNIIFVDQPAVVGYSKVESKSRICKNETCVASDFHVFLVKFISEHPEFKHRPLYITGESYAGHYIPAIASYIAKVKHPWINLKGVAIGNAFVEENQLRGFPLFLYENNLIGKFKAFIARIVALLCEISLILNYETVYKFDICEDVTLGRLIDLPNLYDIRENKSYSDIIKVVEDTLNNSTIQKLIGVNVTDYRLINETLSDMFMLDSITSFKGEIEFLLDENYEVMLYFGDKDFICNWRGGEEVANSLKWKGAEEYTKRTEYKEWYGINNRTPVGKYKKVNNFNFMVIYNAGHMVPMNQPEISLIMIKRFINGQF